MKKLYITFCVVLCSTLPAQDKKFDVTLKSPDAAQISKFTDIPASTYTGIVSSSIPIYDIKIDKETFPVTINYHGSGVKVKEAASRVGLGWSLSTGNTSLSKQIFGAEDTGWIPNIPMDENYFTPNDQQSTSYTLAITATGFNEITGVQDMTTKRDTQPDIFSYSVNGISGEFHYDHTGKILQIPYQKVKIEDIFKITDDKGIIYNFTAGNSVRNLGGRIADVQDIQTTEYNIQSIIYPSGKKILFEYDPVSYGYLSNYTKRFSYPLYGCESVSGDGAMNEYDEYATYSEIMRESVLRKITFPEGEISFNYDTREDIIDGKRLSSITVRDMNQKIIQNYQFNQSYFISTEQIDVLNYSNHTASLMKRLKLNELVETVENKKYQFEYYEDAPLPNRFSNAVDYLGYYNGELLNTGIEYIEYDGQIYGLGDKKDPHINFAKLGSLKKIKYPTGGSMDFEYESDSFHFNGYEKKITRNDLLVQNSDPVQTISTPSSLSQVNFKIKFSSTVNPVDDSSGSLPTGPHFIGEILNAGNTVVKTFLVVKDYDFMLPAQTSYKVRIRKSGSVPPSEYASLKLEWFEIQNPLKDYDKSVGGIRIKRIVKRNSDNNVVLAQNYKYTLENNRTSGEYFGDKIDSYYFSKSPYGTLGASCEKLIVTNSGNANVTTVNGKPVAYKRVITEVENTTGTEKYKTIDYFTNYPSTNFSTGRQSFFQYANNQYARGILNKKEFYNSSDRLLERQEFDYAFDYKLNDQSSDYMANTPELTLQPYVLNLIGIYCDLCYTVSQHYIPTFEYSRYSVNSSWVKLTTQKSIRFFDNNQSTTETSGYQYDTTYKHLNPTSLTVDFPDNSSQVTTFQYAHEKAIQKLIDAHITGVPLETSVTKKENPADTGSLISKTEAQYNDPSHVFPTSIIAYNVLDGTSTAAVTFNKYDNKGNVLQYTTKEGIPVTVIWGYDQNRPIVRIEGAQYENIKNNPLVNAVIDASQSDMQNPASEPALLTALNNLRNDHAFKDFQITSVTYDQLIGITSLTAPSGIRESYKYDPANRLEKVADEQGKSFKEFKYNYKQ